MRSLAPILFLFLITLVSLARFSPNKVFIRIYLPTLLLIPPFIPINLQGLPDLTYSQVVLVPIFAYCLFSVIFRGLNFRMITLVDILIIFYVASSAFAEYQSTGYEHQIYKGMMWKTILFKKISKNLIPYFLARQLINKQAPLNAFVKTFVFLLCLTIVISTIEWRLVINVFYKVSNFLSPDNALLSNWRPNFRWGFARISGPFKQPIIFGITIAMALFLNHWGKRKKLYSHIPFLSISPGTLYSTLLIIGLVMTLSRGPILSYLIGALFIGIGYLKNRPRNFVIRSITLLCLLAPLFFVYQYYASLDNTKIIAGATGSAVYRTKLIDLYLPFILQKPYWGWGSITYPFVEAYSSIDNHYLFLAIQYGLVTLSLFLSIPMVVIWKLFNQDRKQRFKGKIDPTIIYTLIACYVVILACLSTVYLGEQLEELFFILTGISQGILLSNEAKAKRSLPQTSAKINYHPQTIPVTT